MTEEQTKMERLAESPSFWNIILEDAVGALVAAEYAGDVDEIEECRCFLADVAGQFQSVMADFAGQLESVLEE